MRKVLRRTLLVLALVGAAYAGFRWGPVVFPPLERAAVWVKERLPEAVGPAGPEPTPELADATLERFERFRRGEGEARLGLSGPELSAVLRHSVPGLVPPGVTDPTVELSDGRVRLGARVARDAFPEIPRLDEVLGLLPDTVGIRLEGALMAHDRLHLGLVVDEIEAGRIPLPRRFIGDVLAGLGRVPPAGLPREAITVPLPDGLQSVYVQGDSLFLVSEREEG
jgi:hypothetical protein